MYKDRNVIDYLNDILESIKDIRNFTAVMDCENFINDRKTMNAVVRSLEIIGMRNKIAYEYFE